MPQEEGSYENQEPHKRLLAWQRSVDFVVVIYELTKKLPKEEEFGLKSQLRRAAVSVPSNIAEGLTRKTKNDKVHFLNMAQGSVSEIDTQLIVGVKLGYFYESVYEEARPQIVEIEKLLSGLINKLSH